MAGDVQQDGTGQNFVMLPAAALGFLMYGAAQQLLALVPPANDRVAPASD